jgi:ankyrin repeat protein
MKSNSINFGTVTLLIVALMLSSASASTKSSWKDATTRNTVEAYNQFLLKYPKSEYAETARLKVKDLRWQGAISTSTIASYEAFIQAYPGDPLCKEATVRIEKLSWQATEKENGPEAYRTFLSKYPTNEFATRARQKLETFSWEEAKRLGTVESYRKHLSTYPDGQFKVEAITKIEDLRHTAMISAAQAGNIQVIASLLDEGLNVNAPISQGKAALHFASATGQVAVVEFLIRKGANVDLAATNASGVTPLILAAINGHADVVKTLLKSKANPEKGTAEGATPLIFASMKGYVPVIEALLEVGANANAKTQDGWTALLLSAREGKEDALKLLLNKGGDPSVVTSNGESAMDLAFHGRHYAILKNLLERKFPSPADSPPLSAIEEAIRKEIGRKVELAAGRRIDVSVVAVSGPRPETGDRIVYADTALAGGGFYLGLGTVRYFRVTKNSQNEWTAEMVEK